MIDAKRIFSGQYYSEEGGWIAVIYIIKNKANGYVYIGQSKHVEDERWKQHVRDLNRGTHANKNLQEDWRLYGKESFVFEILEYVFSDFANKIEDVWIKSYSSEKCYNIKGNSAKRQSGFFWERK